MSNEFILVDLDEEQKSIVLDKASFYIFEDETKMDLNNKRKKWIRFKGITCNRSRVKDHEFENSWKESDITATNR